jgi:hypothetical protein
MVLPSRETALPAASLTLQREGLHAVFVSGEIRHLYRPMTASSPARHRLVLERLDELLMS